MKILLKKTSEYSFSEIREYKDLEEAVNALLTDRSAFEHHNTDPLELIISKPYEKWYKADDEALTCDYVIEIYDDWRE